MRALVISPRGAHHRKQKIIKLTFGCPKEDISRSKLACRFLKGTPQRNAIILEIAYSLIFSP